MEETSFNDTTEPVTTETIADSQEENTSEFDETSEEILFEQGLSMLADCHQKDLIIGSLPKN